MARYENLGCLFKWTEGNAYLIIDRVAFDQKTGAILCFHNPPVHQVGTTALFAFHDGLDLVFEERDELDFLLLCGANGPVHSGGDLKESLSRLKRSIAAKGELEAAGGSEEEIDRLFSWGESRLEKGVLLYKKIRRAARFMRTVAVCGGGLRFGGSAEIPLMTDYIISDSRSGMCFSEALIGIIPGWGGITRALVKSGRDNAAYMAKTANPVSAFELRDIGIYDHIVEVPFGLPERHNTGDPDSDKRKYQESLEDHDDRTGAILLPEGLKWATCAPHEIQSGSKDKKYLSDPEEMEREVGIRSDPDNYAHIWGRPLGEVKDEIARLGRPLAPQSIDAIDQFLKTFDPSTFDEAKFVDKELRTDAALYRDPRFLEGLSALLDHRVPDFRHIAFYAPGSP